MSLASRTLLAVLVTSGVSASPAPSTALPGSAPAPTVATGGSVPAPVVRAADSRLALLAAMQDELARSMERLRLDAHERPYFISYLMRDTRSFHVTGRHGAVTEDRTRNDRRLLVDVRVGSHDLDDTGADDTPPFTVGEGPAWTPSREAPLDDDPAALRSALWLLTDDRYKDALASWYRKRGRGVYRTEDPDRAPSFTREAPQREVEPPVPFPFDRERWRGEVRALSAALRSRPEIFDATVRVEGERQVRWLASSEGTALVTEGTLYAVHL